MRASQPTSVVCPGAETWPGPSVSRKAVKAAVHCASMTLVRSSAPVARAVAEMVAGLLFGATVTDPSLTIVKGKLHGVLPARFVAHVTASAGDNRFGEIQLWLVKGSAIVMT